MSIHPSAAIDSRARLGLDVTVGPFCVLEADTSLGDGCVLESHVIIKQGTTLGAENHVYEGAVLGGAPQHVQVPDQLGRLDIGARNTIREHVTIHCGLSPEEVTRVGDSNMIMINAHIAHDCHVGNQTVLINNCMIAGHATIEDRAYLAGGAGIQQFRRVGQLATIGGYGRVVKDVPPYVTLDGSTGGVVGLNLVGLRRAGFDRDQVREVKEAYRLIYRSGLPWTEILERLAVDFPEGPAADFHRFLKEGQHGFMPERRSPSTATIRLFADHQDEEAVVARAG